jgi:hypothetical protein
VGDKPFLAEDNATAWQIQAHKAKLLIGTALCTISATLHCYVNTKCKKGTLPTSICWQLEASPQNSDAMEALILYSMLQTERNCNYQPL